MLLRCDAGFRLRIAARMQSLKCAFSLMAIAQVTRLFAHFMHSEIFKKISNKFNSILILVLKLQDV